MMSLSPFSFIARKVSELHPWFVDIFNHLSAKNYDNGDWTPTITGMTGSPTVTAWYQRFGIECSFTVIIDGSHSMSSATMSLPISPDGGGVAIAHYVDDNSTVGTGKIDSTAEELSFPDYSIPSGAVLIRGFYKVEGI